MDMFVQSSGQLRVVVVVLEFSMITAISYRAMEHRITVYNANTQSLDEIRDMMIWTASSVLG